MPTVILVIQGDADQVLPLDKTGQRLPGLIKDIQLVIITGGPHAIAWTHAGQVNTALLDFPAQLTPATRAPGAQPARAQGTPPTQAITTKELPCRTTSALTISSSPATTGAWT